MGLKIDEIDPRRRNVHMDTRIVPGVPPPDAGAAAGIAANIGPDPNARPKRGLQYPAPPTPSQAALAYAMPTAPASAPAVQQPAPAAAQPGQQPAAARPKRRGIGPRNVTTNPTEADLRQYGSGPSFVPGNQQQGGVDYGMGAGTRSIAGTMEMDAYTMEPTINVTGTLDELLSSAMRVVQYKSNQNRRTATFKTLLDTNAGYDMARIAGQVKDREGARQAETDTRRIQTEDTRSQRGEALDRDRLALDTRAQDRAHANRRIDMRREDGQSRQNRFTQTYTQILKTLKDSAEIQDMTDEEVQNAAMKQTEEAIRRADMQIADAQTRVADLRAQMKNDGYTDDEIETIILNAGIY